MKKINVLFLTFLVTVSSCFKIFSMVPIVRSTQLEGIANNVTAFYATMYNNHTILGDDEGNIYLHNDAKLNSCEKVFKGSGEVVKIVGSQDDRVIVACLRPEFFLNNEEKEFIVVFKWDPIDKTYTISHKLLIDKIPNFGHVTIAPDNKSLFFIASLAGQVAQYVHFLDLENIPRTDDNIAICTEDSAQYWCRCKINLPVRHIFLPSGIGHDLASNKRIQFFLHGKEVGLFELTQEYIGESERPCKVIKKIDDLPIPLLDITKKPVDTILSEDRNKNLVIRMIFVQPSVSITYETHIYDKKEEKFIWLSTKKMKNSVHLYNWSKEYCFLEKNTPNNIGVFLVSGFELLDKNSLDTCLELNFGKGISDSIVCKVRCNNTLSILIAENYSTYKILKISFIPRKSLPYSRHLRSRYEIYNLNRKFVLKKDVDNAIVIVSAKKHAKDKEKEKAEAQESLESIKELAEEEEEVVVGSINLDDFAYSSSDEEGSDFEEWEDEQSD